MVLAPETTRRRTEQYAAEQDHLHSGVGNDWPGFTDRGIRSRWRRRARRWRIPWGGGGFHAGGGGFHGGGFGFRGGGFRGRGLGFFGPYAYGDYPYYYGDDYEGGCYLVARRILTRYGRRS